MGHGIFYCSSCQTQLREPDFDKGAAYRLEGQSYCEQCARQLVATLPEDRINEILRAFESSQDDSRGEAPPPPPPISESRGNRTTRIMKALAATPGARILTSTSRRMATVPAEQGNPATLVFGIGAAVTIVVALAIVGVSSGESASTRPGASRSAPVVYSEMPAPEDRPTRMIAAAREFAKKNPDDLQKQIALFEEIGMEPGAARYIDEISAVLKELRRKMAERRAGALAPVERETRGAIARQDFKAAATSIAAARARRGDPDWDRAIDTMNEELGREIAKAFPPLREKAIDARRRGLPDETRRIQDRVAGWGRADLSRELEAALAAAVPAPPPPPPPPPPPAPSAAELESVRREAAANELFQSAENLHRIPATRGDAVAKFSQLQADFGNTKLVAANRAVIAERLEAAKDHVLLATDLRPTGAYRYTAWKKAGMSWTADNDVMPAWRAQNFIEVSFPALAGVEYAAWVYAGACCSESFVFYVQGSELSFLDPKTREKCLAELGSSLFVTMKPASNLLKTHSSHSRRDPSLWQWVPISLPKYATAGEKRLRIYGETQGFSVAWAVVSATRKTHPSETEMREAEKQRPDLTPDAAEARLRQGLVAHWKMDEGSGATVSDASGHGLTGTIKNGVTWSPGVIGKALKFDGDTSYVDCGANETFNVRKTITLSAWVRCAADPVQYDTIAMKSNKDWAAGYGMWFESKSEIKFFAGNWKTGVASSDISPRDWNHVAGTYDGTRVRIYVNGKEGTGMTRAGEIPACPEPFTIGRAPFIIKPTDFTLTGEIDDVRLYDRALDESEIRALSAVRR